MKRELRIVMADDHPIVRKGLRAGIEEDPLLRVLAEAGDGQSALEQITALQPDVAVLDINMPRLDGFAVARALAARELKTAVIFLTLHNEEDIFHAAIDAGARGFILKDSATQEICAAIHAVAAGRIYVSSAMTGYLLNPRGRSSATPQDAPLAQLSPSERRIMDLIGEGLSSKEIGDVLKIHYRTVENHRTNICRKLNLEGANALLRFALSLRSK